MRILGIDPGLRATGYGLIDVVDEHDLRMKLLEVGVIEPKEKDGLPDRIEQVYRNLNEIVEQYRPDVMILEKLYAHYKHPLTACLLGHVRGAVCLLCSHRKLCLVEHSVKRIRTALLGNGNASKLQTQAAVAHVLKIDAKRLTLDASDALALALGYVYMNRGRLNTAGAGMQNRLSLNISGMKRTE